MLRQTREAHLKAVAGSDAGVIEMVGKPYDLRSIVDAVRGCLAAQGLT
jgi:hypothetical protein